MSVAPTPIAAMGLSCPLGLSAPAAYAAIRAGLSRFQELAYLDDRGEPLRGSRLAILEERTSERRRWFSLLCYALEDALRSQRATPNCQLFVVLPERPASMQSFVKSVEAALDGRLSLERTQFFVGGPCAAYAAIQSAREQLASRACQTAMVAAADSLIGARALLAWSKQQRLLTRANPDGFVPGEAAAALLLARRCEDPLGSICAVGFGMEPGLLSNDVPLRSQGVVEAARAALSACQLHMHDVDVRLSDATGESYGFKEQALAVLRTLRENKDSFPLWRSAASLGHTGVASSMCNLVIALCAARVGRFPGRRAIAYAADDDGKRAALILEPNAAVRMNRV